MIELIENQNVYSNKLFVDNLRSKKICMNFVFCIMCLTLL